MADVDSVDEGVIPLVHNTMLYFLEVLIVIKRFLFAPLALVLAVVTISGCSESVEPVAVVGGVTEFVKTDLVVGDGLEAVTGKTVSVHYTGWLYDESATDKKGEKFDSSRDRGQPFDFPLGEGRVIKGWDQGVAGMMVGGQRTLTIPPELGYGSRGAGGAIPPNASLIFDVELLNVR